MDSICPIRLFKINLQCPEWFSEEVMEQSIKCSRLYRIARRSKNPNKKESASESRNVLKTMIISRKNGFYLDYFKNYGHDSKKFWAGIGTILEKSSKLGSDVRVIDPKMGLLCSTDQTATVINTIFFYRNRTQPSFYNPYFI